LNIAKYLNDYQKSQHFSNVVKDSSAEVFNLWGHDAVFSGPQSFSTINSVSTINSWCLLKLGVFHLTLMSQRHFLLI